LRTIVAGSDEVLRGKTDDPHVATGLLKLFLRELPQPLLTEQLADRFIAVMGSFNDRPSFRCLT
jgi:hypothetical protein